MAYPCMASCLLCGDVMDVKECLEKGLLKADRKDLGKAQRSMAAAKKKLDKAAKLADAGFYEESLVNAYSAMFHACRSILFRDGFKERSHYAVYVYLRENYKDRLEPRFLNELDSLRQERHEIMYSLDTIDVPEEDCRDMLSTAKSFISAVEKVMAQRAK